ncbi:MAG: hypothetical protein HZA61_15540 [Candidatus Eisenbacteria bacterium]|uniref:Alginate export domain-containing protein n=1 Tax=Eiseniibacteriota bacterium TaxID=2212470 RepID=A0A933SEZ4_UNCEI|nr:hypothetical protein [Candidatus Eisenbacteria bacterium]
MRKGTRVLAAAALALMVPVLAAASTARMSGLNVPGDYVKGDYTGMFTYMSEVNSVGNLAYVEAGSVARGLTDHAVGAVLPGLFDGKYGVWSFHLRQTHPALGQSANFGLINTGHDSADPNYAGEAFDIIWGHKMGNGNLALRLNRSFESYDDGTEVQEGDGNTGRNILGFGGGYGWDMNANTQVELGALYQQRSFDDGGTGALTDDGGTAMLLAARAFRKASGNLTVIPAVKYWSIDQSTTNGTTSTTAKYSGWQAGAAGNWSVGSDDLLVFGANFAQNKGDFGDGNEDTQTFMPNVFMALETHLNPWLSFRAGAQNAMFYSYSEKYTGGEDKWKEHYFTFNLGTTVKMGNLVFDATLDPAFLQNPFAQLMGGDNAFYYNSYYNKGRVDGFTNGFVFPTVSATYTW